MSQVIQGYTQQVKEGDATDPLLVDDQQGGQGQKDFGGRSGQQLSWLVQRTPRNAP